MPPEELVPWRGEKGVSNLLFTDIMDEPHNGDTEAFSSTGSGLRDKRATARIPSGSSGQRISRATPDSATWARQGLGTPGGGDYGEGGRRRPGLMTSRESTVMNDTAPENHRQYIASSPSHQSGRLGALEAKQTSQTPGIGTMDWQEALQQGDLTLCNALRSGTREAFVTAFKFYDHAAALGCLEAERMVTTLPKDAPMWRREQTKQLLRPSAEAGYLNAQVRGTVIGVSTVTAPLSIRRSSSLHIFSCPSVAVSSLSASRRLRF